MAGIPSTSTNFTFVRITIATRTLDDFKITFSYPKRHTLNCGRKLCIYLYISKLYDYN